MNLFLTNIFFQSKLVILLLCAGSLIFASANRSFAQTDSSADDPVAIFNQAQDAHEKSDFSEAVKLYEQALKIAPEFPEAEYQKGAAQISLNQPDAAEKSFRRALELRPDWTLPMAGLGALLVRQKSFAEAEKLLTKATAADEANFSAYSALTDLRLLTGAPPEVLRELLSKIVLLTGKVKPTAQLWTSRALLENRLGDRAAAKTSLNRALELDPKNQDALVERASIATAEGDTAQSQATLATLAKIAPNSLRLKYLQAENLYANGQNADALKILDSVGNPNAEIVTLRDKINVNTATNAGELEKQLANQSNNAEVLGRLCSLLRVENPPKAMDYCRRAYQIQPSNLNHAVGYGAALVQARKFAEAADLNRRLLSVAPDNATVHANLAISLFELKQYADAQKEYSWIAEQQPNSAIVFYFLAITHDQLGEYADATANYQQFLRLADTQKNQLEIEKVNLRLPALQKLIKEKKGKSK